MPSPAFLSELDYTKVPPGPRRVYAYRIQKLAQQLNADALPARKDELDTAIGHLLAAILAGMAALGDPTP